MKKYENKSAWSSCTTRVKGGQNSKIPPPNQTSKTPAPERRLKGGPHDDLPQKLSKDPRTQRNKRSSIPRTESPIKPASSTPQNRKTHPNHQRKFSGNSPLHGITNKIKVMIKPSETGPGKTNHQKPPTRWVPNTYWLRQAECENSVRLSVNQDLSVHLYNGVIPMAVEVPCIGRSHSVNIFAKWHSRSKTSANATWVF